jgi:hypothetical protein
MTRLRALIGFDSQALRICACVTKCIASLGPRDDLVSPARKRPEKTEPTPPEQDVRQLQDPERTEADFLRDLERAATNRAAEKLKQSKDT